MTAFSGLRGGVRPAVRSVTHPINPRSAVARGIVAAAIAVSTLGIGVAPALAHPLDHVPFQVSASVSIQSSTAVLPAPFLQQMDGTIWGESNCGPTSLAMALGAVGISAAQNDLRLLANQQMGNDGLDSGTSWAGLAFAAAQSGAKTDGPFGPTSNATPRSWSIDDLTNELKQNRPVVLLVHRGDLTELGSSSYAGDHYIVAVGTTSDGSIVYNDPAMREGANRQITPDQLLVAWSNTDSGFVRTAMGLSR